MHLYAHGGHAFGAAAHEISGDRMAAVGGDLAGEHRDDFAVGALGAHFSCSEAVSRIGQLGVAQRQSSLSLAVRPKRTLAASGSHQLGMDGRAAYTFGSRRRDVFLLTFSTPVGSPRQSELQVWWKWTQRTRLVTGSSAQRWRGATRSTSLRAYARG